MTAHLVPTDAEETQPPSTRRARLAASTAGIRELPRSVRLALASLFIVNGATYVAFPLLAVKLTQVDHLPAARVGTVLTVFLLAARLLPMAAGPIADRYDPRIVMMVGAASRGLGFLGLGLSTGDTMLLVSAFFAGAGAIFEAPVSGLMAAQPEPIRSRAFATENAVLNASVIVGPALAAVLVRMGLRVPFVCSGILFALIVFTVVGIKAPPRDGSERRSAYAHARSTLANRKFVLFWVLMLPWWFLFTQLGVAVPLRSNAVAGPGWIGTVYVGSGVAGLVYIPFVKALQTRIGNLRVAAAGYAVVASGLGLVALSQSKWWLLACVVVYMLGETMVLFSSQMILASFADEGTRASYFGRYAGSWAVGGTIGNYVGVYATAQPLTSGAWLLFGGVGLAATAVFMIVFGRAKR